MAEAKKIPRPAKDYALIRLAAKRKSTDPDMVSVGVDGEKWRYRRNEIVPVPARVVEALRHATEPVPEAQDIDVTGQVRRRKVVNLTPRFPFELIAWVDEQTYQHFRKIAKKRSIDEDEVYGMAG